MRLTVYGFQRVVTGTAREEFVGFAVPSSNPRLRLTITLSDADLRRIREGLLDGRAVEMDEFHGDPVAVRLVADGVPEDAGY